MSEKTALEVKLQKSEQNNQDQIENSRAECVKLEQKLEKEKAWRKELQAQVASLLARVGEMEKYK